MSSPRVHERIRSDKDTNARCTWLLLAATTALTVCSCSDCPPATTDYPAVITANTPAGTGHEMVLVPAGDFAMGSSNDASDASEGPVHTVCLDAYYVGRHEVSNAQYQAYVQATGRAPSEAAPDERLNGPEQPVVGVTWYDARDYCAWAGLRLPTEAEWEKAARGTDGREYPWGNTAPDGTRANYEDAYTEVTGSAGDGYEFTAPVGNYPAGASPFGALDMAGNVWEWTADWFDSEYYTVSPGRNPKGPSDSSGRVLRGGSWHYDAGFLRASSRFATYPGKAYYTVGFRCAKDA